MAELKKVAADTGYGADTIRLPIGNAGKLATGWNETFQGSSGTSDPVGIIGGMDSMSVPRQETNPGLLSFMQSVKNWSYLSE